MKLPEVRHDPAWSHIRRHDVEELWDHSIKPHAASAYAARLEFLLEAVGRMAGEGGRVLDVGCAQGTLGLLLAERGFQVTLLDVRQTNIDYARARYERGEVEFVAGMLDDKTPAIGDYDVVVCTEVLEHVTEPARLLAQLAAKTRRGGRLCLTTPNADYLLSRLPSFARAAQSVIDGTEENSLDGDAHQFLYTREELMTLARGVGLQVDALGFFVPVWLEGHAKTRYLHQLLYRLRGHIVRLPATVPKVGVDLSRYMCSSQWLLATRP